MSSHVLLNALNKLGKIDARPCRVSYRFYTNSYINSIK